MYTYLHKCVYMYVYAYLNMCKYIYIHKYIYKCVHTNVYIHRYIHICIYPLPGPLAFCLSRSRHAYSA